MKYALLPFCLLVFLLPSCRKNDDNKPSNPAVTKKLVKEIATEGRNSFTTTYTYGTDGKLASVQHIINENGITENGGIRITRNANGMIEKIAYLEVGETDSVRMTVSSDGQRYTSTQWTIVGQMNTINTKINFTSDAAGRIAKAEMTGDFGGTPMPLVWNEFAYSNNNLASVKTFQLMNNSNMLIDQTTYEYDAKNNPLPFGNEWILLSFTYTDFNASASANNATKTTEMSSPAVHTSYTYNEQNLPVTATSTMQGQPVVTRSFTYE